MALYRENSTGFVQEWASNPGATHTAITAQPTDTLANRVVWWRNVDKGSQTSSWHPSEYRSPQDPAEAVLSMTFSKSAAFFSADSTGAVTDAYLGGRCTVSVYRGGTDVTDSEGWTLTKVDDGCTSTLTKAGGVWTLTITNVPLLATKSGYVRVTATRTGSTTQTRDWSWMKVQNGSNGTIGQDGTRGSRQILVTTADGVWSDLTAWNGIVTQTGTTPVLSDLVTIAKSDGTVATSKFCTGNSASPGVWTAPSAYINGSLLVTGSVGANQVAANSITAAKMVAGTITSASGIIADAAITTAKIENLAVTAAKIANTTITAAQIANATITAAKIANATITGAKIASATITDANIASLSASKINAGSLSATYISAGTLDCADFTVINLSASAINTGTLNGTNVSVTNLNATNITTGTLNGARVGSGVSGTVITDATITSAKIVSLDAGKITTGTMSAQRITAGTITADRIVANACTYMVSAYQASTSPVGPFSAGTETEVWSTTLPAIGAGDVRGPVVLIGSLYIRSVSGANQTVQARVYRDGTSLGITQDYRNNGGLSTRYATGATVRDSAPPATAVVYSLRIWSDVQFDWAGCAVLMELAR